MTSDWRRVLERAAAVEPRAEALLPAIAELLDEGLRGAPSQQALQRAYDVTSLSGAKRNPFSDSLAEAAEREAGHWPPPTLAAVRACLRLVPQLMLDLYGVFLGEKVFPTQGDESFPARVAQLGAAGQQQWAEPKTSATGYVCGRCTYRGVDVRRETSGDKKLLEGHCPACGAHRVWPESGDGWPRVDDGRARDERLADRDAVRDFFSRRGDDPFVTPRGFTFSRKSSEGLPLIVEVAHKPEQRIYHVIAGPGLGKVPRDRRAEVALELNEINREIEAQGFLLGERIAYRTHAYANADGSISSQVIADTVDVAVGLVDRYRQRLRDALGE